VHLEVYLDTQARVTGQNRQRDLHFLHLVRFGRTIKAVVAARVFRAGKIERQSDEGYFARNGDVRLFERFFCCWKS
jgi:hypothetical protein